MEYITKALALIKDEWKEEKVFIVSECEYNETPFEKAANTLRIGVVAKSDIGGRVLLAMLRNALDGYNIQDLIDMIIENYNDVNSCSEKELDSSVFLEHLSNYEDYVERFDGDTISLTLYGLWDEKTQSNDTVITRKKSEIKLYDREAVMALYK